MSDSTKTSMSTSKATDTPSAAPSAVTHADQAVRPCAYRWVGPRGQIEYDESPEISGAARAAGWRAEPLFDRAEIDAAEAAADEIGRLRELLSEISDQARHPDYDWPLWLCQKVAAALRPNARLP